MKNYKTFRRTQSEKGFTLIELLVVILIIAILAAVGIVALLSALNSGRKSSATTVLRNGITAVRAAQSSRGQTDYTGLTATVMTTAEPDITWLNSPTEATAGENSISISPTGAGNVFMATKSEKGVCYYVLLYANNPGAGYKQTMYSSASSGTCNAGSTDAGTYQTTTKAGWNN